MYQRINIYDFHRAFERSSTTSFSYEGLDALFEYLEEYEDSGVYRDSGSIDVGQELCVADLKAYYYEWDDFEEFQRSYPSIESIEDITDHTAFIDIEGSTGFITHEF